MASAGHVDIIRLLINAGADLQKADNFGSTPLHLACIYGHVNCVRVLCELVRLAFLYSIVIHCSILKYLFESSLIHSEEAEFGKA